MEEQVLVHDVGLFVRADEEADDLLVRSTITLVRLARSGWCLDTY